MDHLVAESQGSAIVEALAEALVDNALPGENEGFDRAAAQEAAQFIANAAQQRKAETPVVVMETMNEGAGKRLMRIAIVNDDMPFLVDSIGACVSASGLSIHRLIHPIISVDRSKDGALAAILPADSPGARRESVIYLETDRADAKTRRALESALAQTLRHVRAAVRDWRAMQAAMDVDCDRLQDGEAEALLRWMRMGNLTQLGHEMRLRDGTVRDGLGICSLDAKASDNLLSDVSIEAAFGWFENGGAAPLIVKSNQSSHVHRMVLIDLFIVPVRDDGKLTALSIHAGLWTSAALSAPPEKVPVLRAMLNAMQAKFGFAEASHAGKALTHALTALPHDLLIAFDRSSLEMLALTSMSLADRPRPKLALVQSALERHLYAFVWLPRDEVSTARRVAIQNMLAEAAHAPVLSWSMSMDEGGLALLRISLDVRKGIKPDAAALDRRLKDMVRGWVPAVETALADAGEVSRAAALAQRYAPNLPPAYRANTSPEEAAQDILEIHHLDGEDDRSVRLFQLPSDGPTRLRLKLYSKHAIALSDAVPALENFGFVAIDENSAAIDGGELGHVQMFVLDLPQGSEASGVMKRADVVEEAIARVLEGRAENDRFNALIVGAMLDPDAAVLLRAFYRYLRQGGSNYGLTTFVEALRRESVIARDLVALFRAMHDPKAGKGRDEAVAQANAAIDTGLENVSSLDEDRILRLLRAVIQATLRTNAFSAAAAEALAFKIDSAKVPGLPAPLPWREIWVYSPRVEGIHLRAGPVARGGLRWSDRRDDFRTEILGLMKAQRVKNAVIVPTGAKGGFYPKQLPNPALDRDAWLAEGTESYRIFIRSLLSVTDNIVQGKVVHPADVVVRDGDDPYFVVAADKGTATFSDVANAIALDRGFWLGDAFASGGSHGYDHKAMGITARGAWVSVQRHFAEMGTDVQSDAVRVVGVGDMSGDVFGNGMLLSKSIRLVAAFDHRHIFIDPDPDPAKSWAERDRMFKLPRSSWEDYDKALISKGGGVFARNQKSISLTSEIQALLGIDASEVEPNALMTAILKAQADLLWFGGIGTYVKAGSQNHVEVGDPANDRIRVNAEDLRVKVVGEGANLGVTQAGRIAFSLMGGRINTDFIDNSAGVDCSDNEVNIKIALNKEMADGQLAFDARNDLLVSMTDEVAHLVLEDNRLQALGLSIAEAGGVSDLASHVRLIETFEASGRLDRQVEGLAGNQELLRRAQEGHGLTRPELAILLSTAKLALQDAIEHSDLGADAAMDGDLLAAFPPEMRKGHEAAILNHQLRGEIVATKVANRIVNRLGIIHPFALAEEEGCSLGDLASAFVIAERLFDVRRLWDVMDATAMPEAARLGLLGQIARGMRAQIADILRNLPVGTMPDAGVKALEKGVGALAEKVKALLPEEAARRVAGIRDQLAAQGAPADISERVLGLVELDGAVGLALLSGKLGVDEIAVTKAFTWLGEELGIDWVQSAASRADPADPWDRLLMSGVARDMQQVRLDFLAHAKKDADAHVTAWLNRQDARITQFRALVARARAAAAPSTAMLAELASQARGLLAR